MRFPILRASTGENGAENGGFGNARQPQKEGSDPMTGRDALLDLAARLDLIAGPERELDYEILRAVDPSTYGRYEAAFQQVLAKAHANGLTNRDDACRRHGFSDCPRYTGWLDSALTLVPKHYRWLLDKRPFADSGRPDGYRAEVRPQGSPDRPSEHWGPTPAIALCIAALKALAAVAHEQEGLAL